MAESIPRCAVRAPDRRITRLAREYVEDYLAARIAEGFDNYEYADWTGRGGQMKVSDVFCDDERVGFVDVKVFTEAVERFAAEALAAWDDRRALARKAGKGAK